MKSVDAVQETLKKINDIDQGGYQLKSVLAVSDDALEQSLRFDQENSNLPLQGLPILLKDNIEAVGLPATAGSLALAGATVKKDSTIAQRLRSAGAVIVGATNLSEWANIRSTSSTSGWSALGGLTANPWIHSKSAGGSSSGSGAAVAAGITQWAIGSETDGSIICPASMNGCVGIKPTVGSIPRDGMIPISASQDSPGPMSQTVGQAALLLDVLTDKNIYLAATKSEQKLTIGIVRQWLTSNSDVDALFEDSIKKLEKAGFSFLDVELTPPEEKDHNDELLVLLYELEEGLNKYLSARPGAQVTNLAEVIAFNREHSETELAYFGQELFGKAMEYQGKNADYLQARTRNLAWAEKNLEAGLAKADVFIGCTYGPAWESTLTTGDSNQIASWITTAPAIAGTPIGTIPMGLVSGLPVGLGFVSGRNQEAKLITAMASAERALDIGVMRPTFLRD